MTSTHRPKQRRGRLLVSLVLCIGCSTTIPAPIPKPTECVRSLDGAAPQSIIALVKRGDATAVVQAFKYPSYYNYTQLSESQKYDAKGIAVLLEQFGTVTAVTPFSQAVEFFQLGVGSGPRPFWWRLPGSDSETREYIYEVQFSRVGTGLLRVMTHKTRSTESPVFVGFGIKAESPEAAARIREIDLALREAGAPKERQGQERPRPFVLWQAEPVQTP